MPNYAYDITGQKMKLFLYGTVLATVAVSIVRSQCLRHYAIYTVRIGNCLPRRVLIRACRGGCFTHARPSQTSPSEVIHFCQCCQQDDVIQTRALLRCPSDGSSSQFRLVPYPINMAGSCRCRPCSVLPDTIVPSEGEILHRSIREANATVDFIQ